ncbi:2TM domain-containing protein [Flagellimonas meishanensis]|uniref:2TM domain-containing protein n=1 Tax=Flagellimonas meishanensis TaxID=2873264 RepID=UPI001CA65BD3|nr:2TM domain-containing protein [[Muricauda] meishanensis]
MEEAYNRLEQAKKRVKQLKKFYSHIVAFIVVNIALIVLKLEVLGYLKNKIDGVDFYVAHWLDWEIISTPIIWGLILVAHGLWVFYWPLTQKWEERQIQKYIEKENGKEHERYR